ncbi:MAG: hypothetical protein FWB75_08455, partial [Oscillospiraceae bacterium]|nr:hypothetical protein [Oscillospiraceae bacterium]
GAPIVWEASTRTVIINTEEEETEEERGEETDDIDENQAMAMLLLLARLGAVDDMFMMILTSVVELVNFYMFVAEPVVLAENAQEYAAAVRELLEESGSGLYSFWSALGEDGPVLGAGGAGAQHRRGMA